MTDFNTYVTSNGLVLAWVVGVAATLGPPAAALDSPPNGRPISIGPGLGPVVLLLALLASLYGGAWMVYLGHNQVDVDAERRYCHFGVCDTRRRTGRVAQPGKGDAARLGGTAPARAVTPVFGPRSCSAVSVGRTG